MPFRIEITPTYVHVDWHGEMTNRDLIDLAIEMPRIGQMLGKVPNVLHTYEQVEQMHLDFGALHAHASGLSRLKLPNRSRTAMVCCSPVSFGMGRMMQSLNSNPDLEMEVFDSVEAARRWIEQAP